MSKNKILVEDVQRAFDPYSDLWFKWKYSDSCFLDKDQILLMEVYLGTGELKEACKRLNISESEAIDRLNRTAFTLHCCESIFFKWMLSEFYKVSREWFINLPISKAPIPVYFRKKIKNLKVATLKQAFEKFTVLDFYKLWPKNDAEDFIQLMVHFECGSLLRRGSNN